MRLRCLIVDDNTSFRDEVRGFLEEQGVDVVGTAGSVDEAVQKIEQLQPDVALIDIDLGGESGIDLARRLAEGPNRSSAQVVLISTHDEADYADLISISAVAGFLPKTDLSATSIRRVLQRP
jgi:DNA-binding NarL/FixJ family response regulator